MAGPRRRFSCRGDACVARFAGILTLSGDPSTGGACAAPYDLMHLTGGACAAPYDLMHLTGGSLYLAYFVGSLNADLALSRFLYLGRIFFLSVGKS